MNKKHELLPDPLAGHAAAMGRMHKEITILTEALTAKEAEIEKLRKAVVRSVGTKLILQDEVKDLETVVEKLEDVIEKYHTACQMGKAAKGKVSRKVAIAFYEASAAREAAAAGKKGGEDQRHD